MRGNAWKEEAGLGSLGDLQRSTLAIRNVLTADWILNRVSISALNRSVLRSLSFIHEWRLTLGLNSDYSLPFLVESWPSFIGTSTPGRFGQSLQRPLLSIIHNLSGLRCPLKHRRVE